MAKNALAANEKNKDEKQSLVVKGQGADTTAVSNPIQLMRKPNLSPQEAQILQRTVGNQAMRRHFTPRIQNKGNSNSKNASIQRYAIQHKDFFWRNKYRVSDDGEMMVRDSSAGEGAKYFYATPSIVTSSNTMLTGITSAFELIQTGNSRDVQSPDGSGKKKLYKIIPKNKVDNTQGNAMNTFDDCGTQAGMVMGHRPGVDSGKKRGVKYHSDASYLGASPVNEDLAPDPESGSFSSAVGKLTDDARDVTREKMTGSTTNARSEYDRMSEGDIQDEAKRLGVNQYAHPSVGESYIIKKVGSRDTTGAKTKWDYHWGGVVARSGSDTITLENHGRKDSKGTMTNKDWYIRMYGALKTTSSGTKDQTFHGENKESGEFGDTPITWRVGGDFNKSSSG